MKIGFIGMGNMASAMIGGLIKSGIKGSDIIGYDVANEVNGSNSEEKVSKGLECGEDYSEFFDGLLII